MINFLKWKREILFLIPSITGGGTSSLFFTNSDQKNGSLTWKKKQDINNFLQSVGINKDKNLKPEDLIKEASHYSTIVPILTKALSTQVAKQIFNGKLYEGTKYGQGIGKLFPQLLSAQKQKIEQQIKNRSKNPKRIKKKWAHDEKKYLEGLKDYVLSLIDENNIQNYFTAIQNNHLLKGKNIKYLTTNNKSIAPLLGFLIGIWIQNHKAGYYIHRIIPYAETFTESTKSFYQLKYKDISLPDKPNYYFPDYLEKTNNNEKNLFKEYIDEWIKGRKSYENWYSLSLVNKDSEIKETAKIEWISPSNNIHKNIALRYLSEKEEDYQSKDKNGSNGRKILLGLYNSLVSMVLRDKKKHDCDNSPIQGKSNQMNSFSTFWGSLTHNPLNIFCINNTGKTQPDFMMFIPDKTSYKSENNISSKIVFYRDDKGFNLLYPINKEIINTKSKDEDNLIKKSKLVDELKKYIEDNFSYLLLKYHAFIKTPEEQQSDFSKSCFCHEMINQLIELMELNQKLKDWNVIWKFYDVRKINNSLLKAPTTTKNNYLNKMGTADINPPDFLNSKITKDLPKLQELNKTFKEYIQKTTQYLNINSPQNNSNITFKQQTNKNGHNYWEVQEKSEPKLRNNNNCMKKEVIQYLLESIFTQQLINKYFKIPLLFESSHELLKNTPIHSIQQASSSPQGSNNSWDQQFLKENWKNFFKVNETQSKLSNLLFEQIKKANILSNISNMSDTTLHYLTNPHNQQKEKNDGDNEFRYWDNISSFITLTNLNSSDNQLNERIKIFITSIYLMENSFEEYRERIRKIIKDEGFGIYAFTLSWNKFCTVDDFLLDPIQKVELDSFWTPMNRENEKKNVEKKEWEKNIMDARQCIQTSDRLSVSSLKKRHDSTNTAQLVLNLFISIWESVTTDRNLKEETLMGFKGLISSADIHKLPEDLYYKIFNFLYQEGYINWTDIESQIKNFKTNHQLIEYIKQIKNIHPSIGKTFEFSDVRQKPETTDEAKNVDPMDWFNLNKRKELLIQFIQKNLLKNQPETQKRFQGLLFEKEKSTSKKSYVFEKNENSSIAYLIQITTNDLKDDNSFFQFIQDHLTPESLIQDIVKQAQNKALQMKAINNFLSRGKWIKDKQVFDFRSGDYFLKNQFSSIVTV